MTAGYVLTLTDTELRRYAMMAATARRQESDLWAAAGIVPGATVADIGCGPGAIAAEVAEVVGRGGRVVAVDQDAAATAIAAEVVKARGLSNVVLRVADAMSTGIRPASVDTAVVRHVLAHNGGQEHAIVEHAASLVRPGGAVLVVDVDLTAGGIDPPDDDWTDLQEAYVRFHRQRGNDPRVGLRLARLLADAGLEVTEHRGWYSLVRADPGMRPPAWVARDALVAAGCATPADLERWGSALDAFDHRPRPATMFFPLFAAVGVRP